MKKMTKEQFRALITAILDSKKEEKQEEEKK